MRCSRSRSRPTSIVFVAVRLGVGRRRLEQVQRAAGVAPGGLRDEGEGVVVEPEVPGPEAPRDVFEARAPTIRTIASGASGSRTTTLQRDRSAPFSSKEGFSVVAPTSTTSPASTKGRKTSCWERLKRWISSRKRMVRLRARSAPGLLEDFAHLLHAGGHRRVRDEVRRGLRGDQPGERRLADAGRAPEDRATGRGPRRSLASRKPLAPTTSAGPSTSSSDRGRMRSASGVEAAEPPVAAGPASGGGVSKRSRVTGPA